MACKLSKPEKIALEQLHVFLEAQAFKRPFKSRVEKLLWLYENDLGTSEEIAAKHLELEEVMKEIARIYTKEIAKPMTKIGILIKKVERVSPKR